MGTKRGNKHGSCRPRVLISVGSPLRVTVACGRGKLLVGLIATRQTIGSPLEMPPSMPPWRLVTVPMRPSSLRTNGSLLSLPRAVATPKPAPYSKPHDGRQRQQRFGQVGL